MSTGPKLVLLLETLIILTCLKQPEALSINCKPNTTVFKDGSYSVENEQNKTRLSIYRCPFPLIYKCVFSKYNIDNVLHLEIGYASPNSVIERNDKFLNLQKLTLINNKHIDKFFFESLRNLTHIKLLNNALGVGVVNLMYPELEILEMELCHNKFNLTNWKKLRTVHVVNCHFKTSDLVKITEATDLKRVQLSRNEIKSIGKHLFENAKQLEELFLNNNLNLVVDDWAFANLTKLTTVNLQSCGMKTVPGNLLKGSRNLKKLFLMNNLLDNLPGSFFEGLDRLKELDLSFNNISALSRDIFKDLHALTILSLERNSLLTIQDCTMTNLGSLNELNLLGNNLKIIDKRTFKNQTHLTTLILSNNMIEKIHEDAFKTMTNLAVVKCDNNYLENGSYVESSKLEKLDYSHNRIKTITSINMPRSVILNTVDLSYNELDDLDVMKLLENVDSKNLEINVSNNKISTISLTINDMRGIHIDIANNPIICSFKNYDFLNLTKQKNGNEFTNYQMIRCNNSEYKEINLVDFPLDNISTDITLDPYWNYSCSKNCTCYWRPHRATFMMDCSARNFSSFPRFTAPTMVYNKSVMLIEINLQNNSITRGPFAGDGYDNVTSLILTNNKLRSMEWIPSKLQVLHLENNKLELLSDAFIQALNASKIQELHLKNNPWVCNCSALPFQHFLLNTRKKVDFKEIFCADTNKPIVENHTLCNQINWIHYLLISILVLIILSVLVYNKWKEEIQIFMYHYDLCWSSGQQGQDNKLYDVFLSFADQEMSFVIKTLLPFLEKEPLSLKVCLPDRDWPVGDKKVEKILESVEQSSKTLVVLTNNFIGSCYSEMEFLLAHTQTFIDKTERLVVIVYSDVDVKKLDKQFKVYLRTNSFIKWRDHPWFWKKLKYRLRWKKLKNICDNNNKEV